MQQKKATHFIVQSSLIAAAYFLLTMLSNVLGLAYGPIQFRISELMNVLAALTPAAIPGLTIGCFISNLASPYPLDILFGTGATLATSVTIYLLSKHIKRYIAWVAIIPAVLFNGVLVGLEMILLVPAEASFVTFITYFTTVGIGEVVVCVLLGVPFYHLIKTYFKNLL